jgi:hypothetical protein
MSHTSLAPIISGDICIVPLRYGLTLVAPAYPAACTALEIAQDQGVMIRDTLDVSALEHSLTPLQAFMARWGTRVEHRRGGPEWVLLAENGRAWRIDATGPGTVLRVTERDGREIVRWIDDEFRDDATDCMGAAVGALKHGFPGHCITDGCDGDPDDGEGWGRKCGNCADRCDP